MYEFIVYLPREKALRLPLMITYKWRMWADPKKETCWVRYKAINV